MSRAALLKILMAAVLASLFFAGFHSYLAPQSVDYDERYDVGRSMQNLEFLEGKIPANRVTFSRTNHPFTGELIIGVSLYLSGNAFPSPVDPRATNMTLSELVAGRLPSLILASVALGAIALLGSEFSPLVAIVGFLFVVSSPGLVEKSVTAFLDIYVAAFLSLSLVSIYWYVRRSRKALWVSAALIGLAIGSKTSWDPVAAGLVLVLLILLIESGARDKLTTLSTYVLIAAFTFAVTNPIIMFRLAEHFSTIVFTGRRVQISYFLNDQSVVTPTSDYSIFLFQQPINVLVYVGFLVAGLVAALLLERPSNLKGMISNPFRLYVLSVIVFCGIDLFLTSATFEFGRNYERMAFYEALAIVVIQGYLLHRFRSSFRLRMLILIPPVLLLSYSTYSYLTLVSSYFVQQGELPRLWDTPSWTSLVGWFLLLVSASSIMAPFLAIRTFGWRSFGWVGSRLKPAAMTPVGEGAAYTRQKTTEDLSPAREMIDSRPDYRTTLSTEVANALASGDPEEIVSHLQTALYAYSRLRGMGDSATFTEMIDRVSRDAGIEQSLGERAVEIMNRTLYSIGTPRSEDAALLKRFAGVLGNLT